MSTSVLHARNAGPQRTPPVAVRCAGALAIGAALVLAGCPSAMHGAAGAGAQSLATAQPPLAWTVNTAQATHTLPIAPLQEKDATPGNQFLVLDVSVRNRDVDPQVLSEGKLIAMDESSLQTFDTPVTVLSDDYLTLQVLAPAQLLRGKIAYEVPEHLPGVLYWSPGDGSRRILLNVLATPQPQRTLADAGADNGDVGPSSGSAIDARPVAPVTAAAASARAARTPHAPAREPNAAVAIALPSANTATTAPALANELAPPTTVAPTRTFIVVDTAPRTPVLPPAPVVVRATAAQRANERELARQQQCQALVSGDDPSQKAEHLGFFAQSCRDFKLPPSWQPARRSLFARASALLARVVLKPRAVRVSDCSTTASRADMLVCADPSLSAMEHQLAKSVARARDEVDDPGALQRAQEAWRGDVRNACSTVGCLQHAYGRRIAQVDALVPMRP